MHQFSKTIHSDRILFLLILSYTHWNFSRSGLWQILMLSTGMQSFTAALHFGFLRTVLWNSCRPNSWHREFNVLVILFSVLLQRKPVHISPGLRKLIIFLYHLNIEEKKLSCIFQILKKKLATYCHPNTPKLCFPYQQLRRGYVLWTGKMQHTT